MSRKFNFKLVALCTVLSAMLVVPALGPGQRRGRGELQGTKNPNIKELKLAPEKEKAVLAVEDKYAKERKEIFAGGEES